MLRWGFLIAGAISLLAAWWTWQDVNTPRPTSLKKLLSSEVETGPALIRVEAWRWSEPRGTRLMSLYASSGQSLNEIPVSEWDILRGATIRISSSSQDLGIMLEKTTRAPASQSKPDPMQLRHQAMLIRLERAGLWGLSPTHVWSAVSEPSVSQQLGDGPAPSHSQKEWSRGEQFEGVLTRYQDLVSDDWSTASAGFTPDEDQPKPEDWVLDASQETREFVTDLPFYLSVPESSHRIWLTSARCDVTRFPSAANKEEFVGIVFPRESENLETREAEASVPFFLLETDPAVVKTHVWKFWLGHWGSKCFVGGALSILIAVVLSFRGRNRPASP
ncbi:MAG: hypothetical protein KDB01_01400 [Planctomycetaceae bacterium]|nr:hypothetical protein [Planctomycetaceae bacterium]